jgi:ribonucleoside-diphosphate reductase subunit M2
VPTADSTTSATLSAISAAAATPPPPPAASTVRQKEKGKMREVPSSSSALSPAEDKQDKREEREDATVDEDGLPRFVGDLSIKRDSDEPILRESGRRFVLFPIQYHEVRFPLPLSMCRGLAC